MGKTNSLKTITVKITMDKLLLVDGNNLLFQMFFGMPSRIINKDGKAIQGTLGFVGALLKIINQTKPTHVAVLFDGDCSEERKQTNADYKANRIDYSCVADEENPFTQIDDVYAALDHLNVKHTESCGCESDDLIAGYALNYGKDAQIVIASFDSDFFQLITPNVSIMRYRGDNTVICDEQYLKNKFNITPSVYADFKSLTGDSADNIKGANKVGPKTAALLINQFGSLQNLIDNADQITKPAIRQSICDDKARLLDNYKIIKLNSRCPLPFTLEELKYTLPNTTTRAVLSAIGL